jgi:hypothetical protein
MMKFAIKLFFLLTLSIGLTSCRTIFGWDIHAPGILSARFLNEVPSTAQRIALFLPDELVQYVSLDRGGRFADPQTYYVGEAMVPMTLEAFQQGFDEFIMMEVEPTPLIMQQYAIPHLVAIRIKEFGNRVTLKGQAVGVRTDVLVFDPNLDIVAQFEVDGSSDALKVFAKKGGLQVNLNAAIENNLLATVQSLQDWLASGARPNV